MKALLKINRSGFTLLEVMIASAVALLVGAATVAVFLWSGSQFFLSSKIAWSQNEAMRSSGKILSFVQNASEIIQYDTNKGTWVQFRFPDGTIGKLIYSNKTATLRDGRLYLQRTNNYTVVVARGLTEIMTDAGFTTPMFNVTGPNIVRVEYRVSEPVAEGTQAADDEDFAACVRFAACLRNKAP